MGHTLIGGQNLLSRGALLDETRLNSQQWDMDQALKDFASQAADPGLLSAFLAGRGISRIAESSLGPLISKSIASQAFSQGFSLSAYKTIILGSEAVGFEVSRRLVQVGLQKGNPEILDWQGENGLQNGLIHAGLNFFTLHGVGRWAAAENIIYQHALQSAGIVGANQLARALGDSPASHRPLSEQFLEAELFNIQQQGTLQLSPKASRPSPSTFILQASRGRPKELPNLKALPAQGMAHASPEQSPRDVLEIFNESSMQYETGILAAKEGLDLFLAAFNLRLSTSVAGPFILENMVSSELTRSFEQVRKSVEAISALEQLFHRTLFHARRHGIEVPADVALKARIIRSYREALSAQTLVWEETLHHALETPNLRKSDYQRVREALDRHFPERSGFKNTEMLPFPATSEREAPSQMPSERELPPDLSARIRFFKSGVRSEENTASHVMGLALARYIKLVNAWMEAYPSQPLAESSEDIWDLLADTRTTLEFLQSRQIESQRIRFEFRRAGIEVPASYQDYCMRFNLGLRMRFARLGVIEGELMPVLSGNSLSPAQHARIQGVLRSFEAKGSLELPKLAPYPQ